MSPIVRQLIVWLGFPCLLYSCASNQEEKEQKRGLEITTEPALTPAQQSAFDALNRLQVNADHEYRFFSTFPDLRRYCYPPDTSFIITRYELLIVLTEFAKKYHKNLDDEERDNLTNDAVQAQAEYRVLYCLGDSSNMSSEISYPMNGTWVIPSVLGRSDVVMNW